MDAVKPYTLRLPEVLLDQLREIALVEQRSINNLVVVALGAFASEYAAVRGGPNGSPPTRSPDSDAPEINQDGDSVHRYLVANPYQAAVA